MFNPMWSLSEVGKPKYPIKVFSCFAGGGGSSMGYKRAGLDVIGCCEIDPKMNILYRENLNPKHNFLMDVRDFNKLENIPEELMGIDILDGSPPCSAFSKAGLREKTWGVKRKFREGQKKQTLDDLFFVFLDTVERLQPKVVVTENVAGMLLKNARGYLNEIIRRFKKLGYNVQLFRLDSAFMDVPQRRERLIIVANNQGFPNIQLRFNQKPIYFGDVRTPEGEPLDKDTLTYRLLQKRKVGDTRISDISQRERNVLSGFTTPIVADNDICPTLTSSPEIYRMYDGMRFSRADVAAVQTFPQDYDFGKMGFTSANVKYICGMSVPPNMMANIANEIRKQWFSDVKETRAGKR